MNRNCESACPSKLHVGLAFVDHNRKLTSANQGKPGDEIHVVFHKDDPTGYVMDEGDANRLGYGTCRGGGFEVETFTAPVEHEEEPVQTERAGNVGPDAGGEDGGPGNDDGGDRDDGEDAPGEDGLDDNGDENYGAKGL